MGTRGARAYFFGDPCSHHPTGLVRARFGFDYRRTLSPFLIDSIRDEFHAHRRLSLNREREPVDGFVGRLLEDVQLVFGTSHTSSIARR